MTNKELAVQLYAASVQMQATMIASPNFKGTAHIPSMDEMVDAVAHLASKLSRIDDNGATIL